MRTLLALLLLAARHWSGERPVHAQHVQIESVGVAMFGTHLDLPGRIAFADLYVAHVFSPVSGRIVAIDASPGDHVRKGAPLLELESPDVGAALADVEKASADLISAERELKRQRELVAAHAGAQRDLDQAESAYDRARAELSRAERRARMLRGKSLDYVTQRFILRAPIAGEVISRLANPGTEIAGQSAGGTSPELFTVGSLDLIWAYADVPESELARVKVGAAVRVSVVAYGDRIFPGAVKWISGALDPTTRIARVRCTLRNGTRELLPEMYAVLSTATSGHEALAVPRSAVVPVGDEYVVFVHSGTTQTGLVKLQRRRVIIGDGEGDLVAVRRGLSKVDKVVVAGAAGIAQ